MRKIFRKGHISIDSEVCHGKPCIAGTRIMVWQILELLESGLTPSEIISEKYFPQLSLRHIRAVLHFAAEQFKNLEFVAFSS